MSDTEQMRRILQSVRDAGAADDNLGGEDWTHSDKVIEDAIVKLQPTHPVDGEMLKSIQTTVTDVCGAPGDNPSSIATFNELCEALEQLFAAHLKAAVREAEKEGFKLGQRVGQYQAADKLYHHTTHLYLFKDDLQHKNARIPERIHDMNRDCEKLLNHNSKVYRQYVRGDLYKYMHPREQQLNQGEK